MSLLYFDQYTLDLGAITAAPGIRWREAGERYLPELFNPGTGPDDVRNFDKLRAEGHRRLVTPFYALALTLIALAGVISGEFKRRGRWPRLVAAGAGAICFEFVALALGPAVTALPALAPLFYIHVIVTCAIAAWFIFLNQRLAVRPVRAIPDGVA